MVINLHALQNAREFKNFPLTLSSASVNLFLAGAARGNIFQIEWMNHNQPALWLPSARKHLMSNVHTVLAIWVQPWKKKKEVGFEQK